MSPARALATGHGGRARQLEIFLEHESPGRLATIQGVFIDMDMSPGTGAFEQDCALWMDESLPSGTIPPGMFGAATECVFVHGDLNQQAFAFNKTSDAVIGGKSRESWRVNTLAALTHETQHALYKTTPHATPAGVATSTCTRAGVRDELTELAATISEFPAFFRAIPAGADASHPARLRLANAFPGWIQEGGENIKGVITKMGCHCDCPEVAAFVIDTFKFVTLSWSAAEKSAYHTELGKPVWGLSWPLSP